MDRRTVPARNTPPTRTTANNRTQSPGRNRTGTSADGARRPNGNAPRRPNGPRPNGNAPRRPNGPGPDVRRGPHNSRQDPPRRPNKRRLRVKPQFFVICCIVLGILIWVLSAAFTTLANNGTYCDNVTINGISITKYGKEEGEQYIQSLFADQLSKTYTLTYGGKTWTFTPADFNATLDIGTAMDRAWNIGHVGNIFDRASDIRTLKEYPVDISIDLVYDPSLVASFVDRIYDDVYIAPVDAVVTVALDQPYITGDSSSGRELDKDLTIDMICTLIETGSGSTVLPVVELEPTVSSDQASEGLSIIVQYSTDVSFRGSSSRFNVRKALMYFNGMCVSPGETVSFNEIVGPRTEERGWSLAPEFAGSKSTKGYGGGVCQASTTLYGAVLQAGMDIIYRNPHSQTVVYVDPSLDAAVFYGGGTEETGKDFVFKNNTENAIYIYTEVTKETATVTIYGVRPAYRYELMSNIISQDSKAIKQDYIFDTSGTHVYYATDTPKLYSEGHAACTSEGWLIAYDWDSGEEVSRKQLSYDSYSSGTDIYWVGIHNADGSIISKENS